MRVSMSLWLLALRHATPGHARPGLHERQEEGSKSAEMPDPTEMPADENEGLKEWWDYSFVVQIPGQQRPQHPKWRSAFSAKYYAQETISSTISGPAGVATNLPVGTVINVGLKAVKNAKSGDIDVALSEGLMEKFNNVFKSAPSCGPARRLVGRAPAAGTCARRTNYILEQLSQDEEVSSALSQSSTILSDAASVDRAAIAAEGAEMSVLSVEQLALLEIAVSPEVLLTLGGVAGLSIVASFWWLFEKAVDKVVDPIIGVPVDDVVKVAVQAATAALSISETKTETETPDDESETCVTPDKLEQWASCDAQNCAAQGNTLECTTDEKKGCKCLALGTIHAEPRGGLIGFDPLSFDPKFINSPECDTHSRLKFGIGVFEGMGSLFCSTHYGTDSTAEVSAADLLINNAYEPKVTFTLKSDKKDCSINCAGMSERLASDCKGDNGLASSGKVSDGCGELSYKFEGGESQDEPEPSQAPGPQGGKPEEKPKPEPNCPNSPSTFPARIFKSDKYQLYNYFCRDWRRGSGLPKILDPSGGEHATHEKPPPHIEDPPSFDQATPETFGDWRVRFLFEDHKDGGECRMTCEEAYEALGDTCKDGQGALNRQGSIDVGCGMFLYHVFKLDVDRAGSIRCGDSDGNQATCEKAPGKLEPSHLYKSAFNVGGFTISDKNADGPCHGNSASYGCKTFVRANSNNAQCELFGYEMDFFHKVLQSTGSATCGNFYYDKDCAFRTDFISDC